jgi:AmmeMemoRadiSam system protein B
MPPVRLDPRLRLVLPLAALAFSASSRPVASQTPSAPTAVSRPSVDSIRSIMAIPSHAGVRGRIDSTSYTVHPAQMAKVWELATAPPAPDSFGVAAPAPGVAGILCPHDEFDFAGRVYRRVIPLVTARTVIVIGVFHRYYKFDERDRWVFDSYRAWSATDGRVPVSSLREALLRRLPRRDWTQDSVAHDAEHSLEPLVVWLRHQRPDLEIVPILVPGNRYERLRELADHLGAAVLAELKARRWSMGKDVAIAISADAIHYGPDFHQTTFGVGGPDSYARAVMKDHTLMMGPLAGEITDAKIQALYQTFVDPDHPDDYRWTWCGRFSVPLGLMLLQRIGRASGGAFSHPVAYGTSVGWPELGLRDIGITPGAPCNLYHFVGYPGVAFTLGDRPPAASKTR